MILLDSSALFAAIDDSQSQHAQAAQALAQAPLPMLLSPFVLAELDYFLARRVGQAAELALLANVGAGAYQLEPFDRRDVLKANRIIERYRNLQLGLADASIVVLAERHGARDVLTLDQRHFRAIEGPSGRPFRLLPADA